VADPRHERLAEVLVTYSTRVAEGELVLIEAGALAEPLIREIYRRVLAAGGLPRLRISLDEVEEDLLLEGSDAQLDWVDPTRYDDIETADVRIVVEAAANTKALTSAAPGRHARHARAREWLRNRYLERAAAGELRWVLTAFPTDANAQDAGMSLSQYENFVYSAGLLDDGDPVERWQSFGDRIERVGEFLSGKSELRVVADGTDLTLSVAGRSWIVARGYENFPDGEVFTAPLETSAQGEIRFTYPAVFQGREVDDVRLRFRDGEVVEAAAGRGQDFLAEMIALDEGARRVGEFAFGLNAAVTQFTRNIGFDEKIDGTVHLALGTAYPESGGVNRSGLHWDMICDLRSGGEVYADGELVYRDGAFLHGLF
jgi:aminopeptidase